VRGNRDTKRPIRFRDAYNNGRRVLSIVLRRLSKRLCGVLETQSRLPTTQRATLSDEDKDALNKVLAEWNDFSDDQTLRTALCKFTRVFTPKGSLVMEIPGYFREIEVGEMFSFGQIYGNPMSVL